MHAFATISAAAFAAVTIAASAQTDAALRHIDRAATLFADAPGDVQQGLAALLDAVAELAGDAGISPQARTSVQAARQELARGRPVVDERVGALLRDAYNDLHGGRPFQQTRSEDLTELMDQLKLRLQSARELAVQGRSTESARALMSVALAIITPMPQ